MISTACAQARRPLDAYQDIARAVCVEFAQASLPQARAPAQRRRRKEERKMAATRARNVLLPWYIGIVIIAMLDIWVAIQLFSSACEAPGIASALVVIAIPAIYLGLMYLTLKSQD
jgi:hypothetical protein